MALYKFIRIEILLWQMAIMCWSKHPLLLLNIHIQNHNLGNSCKKTGTETNFTKLFTAADLWHWVNYILIRKWLKFFSRPTCFLSFLSIVSQFQHCSNKWALEFFLNTLKSADANPWYEIMTSQIKYPPIYLEHLCKLRIFRKFYCSLT